MKSINQKNAKSFGALTVAVLSLVVMFVTAISMSGITHAVDERTGSGRIITVHDRGVEKVILTQSSTVGGALKEAGIAVDSKDAVEPGMDAKLVASDYQVNIYRARPVIIVEGNVRTKVITPYQTAAQIAQSAGIRLYDEDVATLERTDDIVSEGAGLKMVIDRATAFDFTLYGKTAKVRTQGETVGDMLAEKHIKMGANDKVSPSIDTRIDSDISVRLWREGKQTVTVDEAVAFATERVEDADQPLGYTAVRTAGQNGKRSVTYEVIVRDGQEISRKEIVSLTIKQPVKQVVVIGVKGQYTTPSENENITWQFLIGQGFSRTQAAGIMGNMMQENKFSTADTAGGLGIVQWTGGRRDALMAMSYPDNIYTQLNFLMSELNGGYISVKNSILASSTVEDATLVFQNQFERCGICMESQRIQYARNILASH